MRPVLDLPVLGLTLTYTVVQTVYVFLALLLTVHLNRRQGIVARPTLTLFALGVPAGILGAHVLDMLEYWGEHGGPRDMLVLSGSSIYGAFLLVIPAVGLYARSQGISVLRLLDGGAPAMALGEAMTRIGCFLSGCCYGIPWNSPLAVVFPRESFAYRDQIARGLLPPGAPQSLPVVPVQLVSAGLAFIAFVALLRMFLRLHRDGSVFYSFLVFYGALRLGIAPLRQEALRSMVAFSVGFVLIGALGLLYHRQEVPAPASAARRLRHAR